MVFQKWLRLGGSNAEGEPAVLKVVREFRIFSSKEEPRKM